MSGPDALMLNMETPTTPMHTLKVAVLDTSRRGKPVSLDEVRSVLVRHLGAFPRATQRVESIRGHRARPFWVFDNDFQLDHHLDEVNLDGGGDGRFDDLLAELATRQLSRDRPLWGLTLVNGLPNGRQGIVVRVHHAVADGLAALNCFLYATTEADGGRPPEPCPLPSTGDNADHRKMRAMTRSDTLGLITNLPSVVADVAKTARTTYRFDRRRLIPRFMGAQRTSLSTPSSHRRSCARSTIPLADVQRAAVSTGTTVNGVFHGIVAAAVRKEMSARAEKSDRPAVAMFGVCRDLRSTRTQGNDLATAAAYLHTEIDDPIERVRRTAESCSASVALRRETGFGLTEQMATYTGRLGPRARPIAAPIAPRVMNNVTTANMPGPSRCRWIGEIKVESWTSFALAIAPADVNLTAYSYAGVLSLGLITTPESMPDPARFLERIREALDELTEALSARGLLNAEEANHDRI
ncbi:wax ester/triacylglycerol synthase domain-containing protein [Nocardia sp. 348MFTsu5.1]|uniref:wax ester/triacylglycerol synthase domain-containing protein n=1 Tax=Nocardia sp. 348MFTsu5.1 TaxID=1172185 RepID=UPI0012DE625B|nr:wax ester/triacylglycerol synthase domain-containing protein [Nocardia sp. 348MFTsu5.1]